ncbi:MAG TPA: peptidylprolyl isomerase [Thermoanaerobaculia bacterium]|nr:peptidylprolyl isomerase [Thermoanaerobaculia bacterium]
MRKAKRGDTVHVHYTGSLEDGTIFDSSESRAPIVLTLGGGDVIPGFEEAIVGMSVGDTKVETIDVQRAYGDRRDDLIFRVDRERLPSDEELLVGDVLRVGFPDGGSTTVQVTAVEGDTVTLDANHPLAGKTLVFELELVSIG